MITMDMFVGWDGGGTKTRVVCLDRNACTVAENTFGPLNPNGAPPAEIMRTVAQAQAWLQSLGKCRGMVLSVAGISNPKTALLLSEALQSAKSSIPYHVVGDQESALYGAVGLQGAVLIAGTGSICTGHTTDGRTARSGGFGYLVDDEGSGYAIGRDILRAVLRASDGRGQPTSLTSLVSALPEWQDTPAILTRLYREGFEKSDVAALAPLTLEALGDPVSDAILQNAALELVSLAKAVIDPLSLQQSKLALSGSVLAHMQPVRAQVINALTLLYPTLNCCEPIADAAHGAALMAFEMYRKDVPPHA